MVTAFIIGTMSLIPAYADNPPYRDAYWFNYNGDPEVCYLESELDDMDVDGSTGNGDDVETAVELTRAEYNSEVNGLTIAADDSSCSYNRIEVGAKDLSWNVLGQTALTAYWCCGNFGQYAEMEFDFNDTDYDWAINNNACGWFDDKDVEWIANHEFGHTLSLAEHTGTDHSVMKGTCTSQWSGVQSVDESALEARY